MTERGATTRSLRANKISAQYCTVTERFETLPMANTIHVIDSQCNRLIRHHILHETSKINNEHTGVFGHSLSINGLQSLFGKRVFQVTQQRRGKWKPPTELRLRLRLQRTWTWHIRFREGPTGRTDCSTSFIFDVTPNRSVTLSSPFLLLPTAELMDSCRPWNPPSLRTG